MLLEYVSRKISRVRWISSDNNSLNAVNAWVCGTRGEQTNSVSVWGYNQYNCDSTQLNNYSQQSVSDDVTQIVAIPHANLVLITLANGNILCYNYSSNKLELRNSVTSVHRSCNDSVYNSCRNVLLSSGDHNVISVVDAHTMALISKCKSITNNSIECIDLISSDQLICGTCSGHLKLYDIREDKMVMSMANEQQIITAVKRNAHNSHLLCCGNDRGVISLWDLRNNGKQLIQVSAHDSFISEIRYKANEPNILITSSFDGQLLRWNLSQTSQLSVDAILGRDGGSPINSFDINDLNEIIFSTDNEVLYLGRL